MQIAMNIKSKFMLQLSMHGELCVKEKTQHLEENEERCQSYCMNNISFSKEPLK